MMGLLTQYQDEAERLARQDKNLMRGYAHDVRGLKAEAAPHEATVKDYNTQVDGFKNSAVKVGPDELWSIVGWVSGGTAYQPVKYDGVTQQYPYAPEASSVKVPGVGIYKGAGASGQLMAGWYNYGDGPNATVRDSTGQAIAGRSIGDIYNPTAMYASWNDRPFVAPVTQSQIDSAKASDETLKGIGGRGEVMRGEFDASQGLLSKKADRLEGDVSMNQGALAGDMQPEAGASVFDQTKVFQSITDWLKG